MSRTTAHTGRRASVYEGNPGQNKSTWQKACDEPFGNSRPGEKWASCTECGEWVHRFAQAGIDVMFATIVNLTNVGPYLRLISPCLVFGTIKCLILTHINGASTYPGVRVNLPRIWGRLTQVKQCHITYPKYYYTSDMF